MSTVTVPVNGVDRRDILQIANATAGKQIDKDSQQQNTEIRILVVDTNRGHAIEGHSIAQTIVGYLTGYGYIIEVAKDHNEAFQIFQRAFTSKPFHLVITNLKGKTNERDETPQEIKDGAELIKRIKEISMKSKVLLYTASPPESTQADQVLEKPCDQDRFAAKVKELLERQD